MRFSCDKMNFCAFLIFGILLIPLSGFNNLETTNFKGLKITAEKNLLKHVILGLNKSIIICGKVFKWDRWNCPESEFFQKKLPGLMITKEKALMHAVLSAGITHEIMKRCINGNLLQCPCNYLQKRAFRNVQIVDTVHVDCPSDFKYARRVAEDVLSRFTEENDLLTAFNSYNAKTGGKVAVSTLKTFCQCYDSCTNQLCWKSEPDLTLAILKLRKFYKRAVLIEHNNRRGSKNPILNLVTMKHKNRLIYSIESPNFCYLDNSTNWPGTLNRECSRNNGTTVEIGEIGSCRHLCLECGFKVNSTQINVKTLCNCNLDLCCTVNCQKCLKAKKIYFCN